MSRDKFDLEALKANGFATNDRRYLEKAHTILLGYDAEPQEDADVLKARLREVCPVAKGTADAPTNVVPIHGKEQPVSLKVLPNLTGNGRWDGRMRRVTYIKADPNSSEDVITCRWEQVQQDLINGQATDLIWPLWEAARNAVDITLEKDFEYEQHGKHKGKLHVIERTINKPKYTLQDWGDVPGTEDKPESYLHYFWQVAKQTNMFANVSRSLLLKVFGILSGETKPITEWVGVTDQDIRLKIAVMLGPEFEDMMGAELYGVG